MYDQERRKTMNIKSERLIKNLNELRKFTDTPGDGVTRFSYGEQDRRAREYIIGRAESAGCVVEEDELRNLRIRNRQSDPEKQAVLCGSHVDTVRNGGWLDGIYGVCSALEVMETLSENAPDASYEMVVFAEEEGSNFGSTMTGSKFITGKYRAEDMDRLKNDDDQTLREVLRRLPQEDVTISTPWDLSRYKAMLELHIEQGPVLDRAGLSLGIVEAIFGMRVIEVTLTGVGNHAGATPMTERYDALSTAAECILAAESLVKADSDRRTVVTVGKMEIRPNCSNVIPETVKFSLEVRDKDEAKINGFMEKIIEKIRGLAAGRGVGCEIAEHSHSAPLKLDQDMIGMMQRSAQEKELPHKVMDSGAVHDACMIAEFVPTGMIFVPSIDGRSHVPEENTREEDLTLGAQFLLDVICELI